MRKIMICLIVLFTIACGEPKLKLLEKMAKAGNLKAQIKLSEIYRTGDGVEVNEKKAFHWLSKAAEQDNPIALYNLSLMYLDGIGVQSSLTKAFLSLTKAAEMGLVEAQFNLGSAYSNDGDHKKGHEWFMKAAEQGYSKAQYNVGVGYLKGSGVKKDNKKAFEWIKKSAEQGDSIAQGLLSKMYFQGIGVKQNTKKGREWFLKQSDTSFIETGKQIEAESEKYREVGRQLASLYIAKEYGKNKDKSFKRVTKGADQRDPKATFYLALHYFSGTGTERNEEETNKWIKIATDYNDPKTNNLIEQFQKEAQLSLEKNKEKNSSIHWLSYQDNWE